MISTICTQGTPFPMYKIINGQYALTSTVVMWGELIGIKVNPTVETGYMSMMSWLYVG